MIWLQKVAVPNNKQENRRRRVFFTVFTFLLFLVFFLTFLCVLYSRSKKHKKKTLKNQKTNRELANMELIVNIAECSQRQSAC